MKKVWSKTFYSVEELRDAALDAFQTGDYSHADKGQITDGFDFHGVRSTNQLNRMVKDGVEDNIDEILNTAENVVSELFMEHSSLGFHAYNDVSGGEVDIDNFLAGIPEHMIEYTLTEMPKVGRVITLVSSSSVSFAVSRKTIEKRGRLIAALAVALSRLGFALELWSDMTLGTWEDKSEARIRTLVKGASDDLDIGRVMYAFTHPSMFRALGLAAMHKMPRTLWSTFSLGGSYGIPAGPWQDMADGTIYLPQMLTDRDIPDADVKLREIMRELGIITD